MRKVFLFIFLILMSIFSVSAISFIGERTEDNYCQIQIINEETFDTLRPQYSIDDFLNSTYQEMVSNNFSSSRSIEVPVFNDENLKIIFTNQVDNNEYLFGTYSGAFEEITIYIKSIHDDGVALGWSEEWILNKIKNTYLHEVAHYLDLRRNIYGNHSEINQVFGIEGVRDINVTNIEYFENLYPDVFETPDVDPELRQTVQYDLALNSYDEKDYYDEIIARTSALCLYQVDNENYEFDNVNNFYYCNNNFNLTNDYVTDFENIDDRVLITWFYYEFPENRSISINLDGLCATQNDIPLIFQVIETVIEEVIDLLTDNYLYLIVSVLFIGFITSIILLVRRYVMNYIKLK